MRTRLTLPQLNDALTTWLSMSRDGTRARQTIRTVAKAYCVAYNTYLA